ncbi:MAG: hypothetical protein KIT34_18065 [Cyanobacteria bacterium TGS_CYA1]|nr:hypothetical protein [Cyanobacteria bacterium TGS_CYA1]
MQSLPSNFLSKLNKNLRLKLLVIFGFVLIPPLVLLAFTNFEPLSDSFCKFLANHTILLDEYESSGSLKGAPVDPRYGECVEVGQLADFGYDTARDCSRLLTLLSYFISSYFAARLIFFAGIKKITPGLLLRGLLLQYSIPIFVHLAGTFFINNYGGIGGGL